MTTTTPTERSAPLRPRRRFDPIAAAAAFFFIMTIIPLGLSAFQAGPVQGPWLMLIGGTAGVLLICLFAFGSERGQGVRVAADDVLEALDVPAAVAAADGRLLRLNDAWREALGESARLPRADAAGELYAALGAARAGETGRALLTGASGEREAVITRAGDDRFLPVSYTHLTLPTKRIV